MWAGHGQETIDFALSYYTRLDSTGNLQVGSIVDVPNEQKFLAADPVLHYAVLLPFVYIQAQVFRKPSRGRFSVAGNVPRAGRDECKA